MSIMSWLFGRRALPDGMVEAVYSRPTRPVDEDGWSEWRPHYAPDWGDERLAQLDRIHVRGGMHRKGDFDWFVQSVQRADRKSYG
jgi:hypothetical protein